MMKYVKMLQKTAEFFYGGKREKVASEIKALYTQATIKNSNEKILFWVPGGSDLMLQMEGAIAVALQLRGVLTHLIISGNDSGVSKQEQIDCAKMLDTFGLTYSYVEDYFPADKKKEITQIAQSLPWQDLKNFSYESLNIGPNIQSSVLRNLQGADYINQKSTLSACAYRAMLYASAAAHAIEKHSPSKIFMSHGVYAEWGPALQLALKKNIPVSLWSGSYKPFHFYFLQVTSSDGLHPQKISNRAWEYRSKNKLTINEQKRLSTFFFERYTKGRSFDLDILYKEEGVKELRNRYQLNEQYPVWGILCHVNWDNVSDTTVKLYDTFNEWIIETIEIIKNIKHINWLIKIHPCEATSNPRNGIEQLIKDKYPTLPSHIKVISALEKTSPQSFYQLLDGGITVAGTGGIELALLGKPVILAGKAYYGEKGFTYDSQDIDQYTALLHQTSSIQKLTSQQIHFAELFAYTIFIQKPIPFSVVNNNQSKWWKFQFDKSHLLLPGQDPFIDFICQCIIENKEFIMDEPLVERCNPCLTNSTEKIMEAL